ncbi:(R)-mandelonitrile lyase [Alteromonas lipolytica]|uniref:Cupin n=1 Tax=Alteromonas lipolytica TaxID=1856405 RepID=A0A1E8FJ76_9ALTE|nr:cupin domain-containing protein [Alteromonas lipolytica]OFI35668.1 cupin [Alteromonas lipolytica]GGF78064.1 cupin [Alteromonas lipolytica]
MKVIQSGSQPSSQGTDENFTGAVRRDPLVVADEPGRVATGLVTFEPGARTHWHVHPLGQILVITQGCGWVQAWGEEKYEVRAGDVVWISPHEKHWHGASDTTAMSHIAITEALDGSAVEWQEPVTDQQFS